jgi:hypothetical protein
MLWLPVIVLGLAAGLSGADPVVTIVNSGSTDRAGFRIAIDAQGNAEATATPRRLRAPQQQDKPQLQTIPPALFKSFGADLDAAKPLASLPEVHCMKSASFGSRLTVESGAEETPDLSCGDGGSNAMRNLIRDVNEITALFAAGR